MTTKKQEGELSDNDLDGISGGQQEVVKMGTIVVEGKRPRPEARPDVRPDAVVANEPRPRPDVAGTKIAQNDPRPGKKN